jgi:hypothetical protein
MRTDLLFSLLAPALALSLLGCGSVTGDNFQAGDRLLVAKIADANGANVPILNAVIKTDDSGKDGNAAQIDSDGSQGDGFPDEGEKVITPLSDDQVTISLKNEPRLGVDPGVDLHVFRVDTTFVDASGATRTFAPPQSYSVSLDIPSGESADLTAVLVPASMKANGLQDIFLFGTADELRAVQKWNVVVDIFARDLRNSDTVHAQGVVSVVFKNPMLEPTQ